MQEHRVVTYTGSSSVHIRHSVGDGIHQEPLLVTIQTIPQAERADSNLAATRVAAARVFSGVI